MHPAAANPFYHRYLPAVTGGLALESREPLAQGLRRVTVEQFDLALAVLADQPHDVAVHEVRKATKRVRAVLRMVRPALGARYKPEDAILRDIARVFAPYRDAHVRVASLEAMRARYDVHLRPTAFEAIADRLNDLRERRFSALENGDDLRTVAFALRSARARYAAWPVDKRSAQAHGTAVIEHRFRSVGPGVDRTYAFGRDQMRSAERHPSAEQFHGWRKQAKYLRHQLEVLAPLFPEVLLGHAASLERLGDLLGEEHDLAELLRFLAGRPDLAPDTVERSMLVALVQHRRAELQAQSLSLGRRIYAESSDRFTRRIGTYWSAWDTPTPIGFSPE
ncbi:MAG: CHAD domain-containing protein [Acidimicrobiia bacterium]